MAAGWTKPNCDKMRSRQERLLRRRMSHLKTRYVCSSKPKASTPLHPLRGLPNNGLPASILSVRCALAALDSELQLRALLKLHTKFLTHMSSEGIVCLPEFMASVFPAVVVWSTPRCQTFMTSLPEFHSALYAG